MRRLVLATLGAALTGACAPTEVGAPSTLLWDTYDVVGVGRVSTDGLRPERMIPLRLRWSALTVRNGQVKGSVQREGGRAFSVTGTYEGASGELIFKGSIAALTSSVTETIERLGAQVKDGIPTDGIGSTLTGYLRTRVGPQVVDGRFVGTARTDRRPDPVDAARISTTVKTVGVVEIRAEAGSSTPNTTVEIFVYTLAEADPRFFIAQVDANGAFETDVDGLLGDYVVIRPQIAGAAGEARIFEVTQP